MTRFFTKCLGLLCMAVLCCFSLQNATAQCGAGEIGVTLEIQMNFTSYPGEVGWQLLDGSDAVVDQVTCGTYASNELDVNNYCLNEGETYTFNAYDSFGDTWQAKATATLTDSGCELGSVDNPHNDLADASSNPTMGTCSGDTSSPQLQDTFSFDPGADILGCTDPAALNYDGCATSDDGTCAFPPTNDFCVDAETIECGDLKTTDTSLATNESSYPTFCSTPGGSGGDVWYKFTGTGENVTASLCGSSFDTKIRVYTGTCSALVCEIGNDDACGTQSRVSFTSVLGVDYYIFVYGFSGNQGLFQLTLDCEGCTNPAASNYSTTANVDDGSCEACTDPTAHNYVAGIANDDGSCETCDDEILNGDEIDVDCGGALCPPCPCGIQVETEIAAYESGCGAGPTDRVVVVTFTGGIPPISYDIDAQGGSLVSQKAPGAFQIIGYGPWSIEASDPSGCFQVGQSGDMVYVSDTEAKKETAVNAENGTATIEVTGGRPPYSIMWSDGTEGSIAASGGTHDNTGLTTGYYEAVVTDDVGGTAKACIYVGRNTSRGSRGRGRKTADVTELSTLMAQPNPLTHSTMIHFNVPESTKTTVSVFALNGKQITTVFDGEAEAGENYHVELNASNMASGVYILRLTTDSGVVSHQRIVVTK